ncbi:MAG: hypothetical protein BWY76_01802 [bacterium ADurb.Bin429]|nr:MAG: hypothetical protein BWY76_01802 [bacterium ADurb.Bin429]
MKDTRITCAMCNHHFTAEEGAKSCGNCALLGAGGCHKVRCPRCGYEMPAPARLPAAIAELVAKLTGKAS